MKLGVFIAIQLVAGMIWADAPPSEPVPSVPAPKAKSMFELKPLIDSIGHYDRLKICKLGKSVSSLNQIGGTPEAPVFELRPPDDTSSRFEVGEDDWWSVPASAVLPLGQAKPFVSQLSTLRQTAGVGGWGCYVPAYGYQFLDGDKVVFELTVSWRCESICYRADGRFWSVICDTSSPAARELLKLTEAKLNGLIKDK